MFERFTQEARQVVVGAQEEARALRHGHIGTEHILLGLLLEEERDPNRPRPLHALGVTRERVRERVQQIVGSGPEEPGAQIPFTPRAKKVLELSLRESLDLGDNWIGTEHILLGLARENDGVASRVLLELGVDPEKIRNEVVRTLGKRRPGQPHQVPDPARVRIPVDAAWLDGLPELLHRLGVEIRHELGRSPDLGDLLLVLASARSSLAGQALSELGIDPDALEATMRRLRERSEPAKAETAAQDPGSAELLEEIRRRLRL